MQREQRDGVLRVKVVREPSVGHENEVLVRARPFRVLQHEPEAEAASALQLIVPGFGPLLPRAVVQQQRHGRRLPFEDGQPLHRDGPLAFDDLPRALVAFGRALKWKWREAGGARASGGGSPTTGSRLLVA